MPPRYTYWTIIAGGLPTAFRMAEREEILPTFKRILERHPDAELKYFARGRLWESQEEAKRAAEERREGRIDQPRRGPAWRPGGSHSDPRQPFRDAKKARNLRWRKERFERRQEGPAPGARPPRQDARPARPDTRPSRPDTRPPRHDNRPPWRDSRPPRENQRFDRDRRPPEKVQRFARDQRPPRGDRPPREKPHGDPLRREVRPRFEKKGFGPPRGSGRRPPGRPPGKPPRGRS